MPVEPVDPPVLPESFPETKEEVEESLSQMQSVEAGYNSICNEALETIEAFLSYPELDPKAREHLRRLLPEISKQKDKMLALLAEAQDTLDDVDEDTIPPETKATYEENMNEFTRLTKELNDHLSSLATVVSHE